GRFRAKDFPAPSTCLAPVCGNGVIEGGEECEPTDVSACPGLCPTCPGACRSNCQCERLACCGTDLGCPCSAQCGGEPWPEYPQIACEEIRLDRCNAAGRETLCRLGSCASHGCTAPEVMYCTGSGSFDCATGLYGSGFVFAYECCPNCFYAQ